MLLLMWRGVQFFYLNAVQFGIIGFIMPYKYSLVPDLQLLRYLLNYSAW